MARKKNSEQIVSKTTVNKSDVILRKVTKSFGKFKCDAFGVDSSKEDVVQQHFLRGAWAEGTLKHYNSAVVKLLRFSDVKKIDRRELLPISSDVAMQFVVWLSKKGEELAEDDESVKSSMIKNYIPGVKAWHIFHKCDFPHKAEPSLNRLVKASQIVEARQKEIELKRSPVLISDLVILAENIDMKSEHNIIGVTIALVAFWGCARLGEIVSEDPRKILPTWEDVEWGPDDRYVKIALREAKTAKPGEVQYIYLQDQKSCLDPVRALRLLYNLRPRLPTDQIFQMNYGEEKGLVFKKSALIDWYRVMWNKHRTHKKKLLHGHSFRIGGASLRWNLGATREEVKALGRWTSDAYKIYLRKFDNRELRETVRLLNELKF